MPRRFCVFALAWGAIIVPQTRAQVVTSTWTGDVGNGAWVEDGNWSNAPPMGGYPDNGNQGFTYDAVVRAVAVDIGQAITINKLTVDNNALLSGPGPLTALGPTLMGNAINGFINSFGELGVFTTEANIEVVGEFLIDDWEVNVRNIDVGTGGAFGAVTLDGIAKLKVTGVLAFRRDGSLRGVDALKPLLPAVTLEGGTLFKSGGFGVSAVFVKLTSNSGAILNSSGREIRFLHPTNTDPSEVVYAFEDSRLDATRANSSIRFVSGDVSLSGTTRVTPDDGAFIEFAGGRRHEQRHRHEHHVVVRLAAVGAGDRSHAVRWRSRSVRGRSVRHAGRPTRRQRAGAKSGSH